MRKELIEKKISRPLLGVALLIFFCFSTGSSQSEPTPPGRLVDLGGYRLHLYCSGEGSPTVILESGAGDFSFDWSLVQGEVSKFATVYSYDRAGYAWSDPGPTPRTLQQTVSDLHRALERSGAKGPFVLVGHSIGGLLVRQFALRYATDVAGVILVDASHEDMLITMTNRTTKRDTVVRWRELSRGRSIPPVHLSMTSDTVHHSSEKGLSDSSSLPKLEPPYDKLPLNAQRWRAWAQSQSSFQTARFSEFDFFPEELAFMFSERNKVQHPLGGTPLIVISAGKSDIEADGVTKALLLGDHERRQDDLTALSTNSKRVVAKNSGHHVQLDEPQLVIDAIHQVVEAIRQHRKLE